MVAGAASAEGGGGPAGPDRSAAGNEVKKQTLEILL